MHLEVSYQIQTHITNVIHVLAGYELIMLKTCCVENKIWTNTTSVDTNYGKVGAW